MSERIERSIRQRRRRTAGTDRAAATAASSSSATRKTTKKRKKPTAKRKTKRKRTTTKKKSTSKTASSGGAKSTTTKKRRRRKRKTKTKGKGKGKGKGKSSAKSSKSEKKSSLSESGPSLSLFGNKYDPDFHGDVEENDRLYPAPSTSGFSNNHESHLTKGDQENPGEVASSSNMLSSILTSQRATLKTGNSSGRGEKMKEVYSRPREEEGTSASAAAGATGVKRSWSAANSSCSSEDSCKENSAKRSNISVRVGTG